MKDKLQLHQFLTTHLKGILKNLSSEQKKDLGLSPSTISSWRTSYPSIEKISQISKLLSISIDEILEEKSEKKFHHLQHPLEFQLYEIAKNWNKASEGQRDLFKMALKDLLPRRGRDDFISWIEREAKKHPKEAGLKESAALRKMGA